MSDDSNRASLAPHILPVAGTMLGICATLIGLVKVFEARVGPSHVDEYAGLIAVMFMVSALASYTSIRMAGRARFSLACERLADVCFLVGLVGLAGVALFFAYELI